MDPFSSVGWIMNFTAKFHRDAFTLFYNAGSGS